MQQNDLPNLAIELIRARAEAAYWKAECEALLAQARGEPSVALEVVYLLRDGRDAHASQ